MEGPHQTPVNIAGNSGLIVDLLNIQIMITRYFWLEAVCVRKIIGSAEIMDKSNEEQKTENVTIVRSLSEI